jgi:hypothetical protein
MTHYSNFYGDLTQKLVALERQRDFRCFSQETYAICSLYYYVALKKIDNEFAYHGLVTPCRWELFEDWGCMRNDDCGS